MPVATASGFVVGVNVAIDLRILGVARQIPLAPMRRLFPWMWAGFVVNALSGIALLIADATTKLANPVFLVKMAFITLGVVNMAWSKRRLLTVPLPSPLEAVYDLGTAPSAKYSMPPLRKPIHTPPLGSAATVIA